MSPYRIIVEKSANENSVKAKMYIFGDLIPWSYVTYDGISVRLVKYMQQREQINSRDIAKMLNKSVEDVIKMSAKDIAIALKEYIDDGIRELRDNGEEYRYRIEF